MHSPGQNQTVVCVRRCGGGGESFPFITSELKFVTWVLEPVLPPVLQVLHGLLPKLRLKTALAHLFFYTVVT